MCSVGGENFSELDILKSVSNILHTSSDLPAVSVSMQLQLHCNWAHKGLSVWTKVRVRELSSTATARKW